MGFWIGVLVGAIASPLILAIISKPLMKWFVKKKATNLMEDLQGKVIGFVDDISDEKEVESNEIKKDKKD